MKRIVTLVLAFALVLVLASVALATEWDVSASLVSETRYVGDYMDASDFKISVTKDGKKASTDEYTIECSPDQLVYALAAGEVEGTQTVNVLVKDSEGTTVAAQEVQVPYYRVLSALKIEQTAPVAYVGDTLPDASIIKVTASFEDGEADVDVTEDCTYNQYVFSTVGSTPVIVATYTLGTSMTADATVTVQTNLKSDLDVDGPDAAYVGQPVLDAEGLEIKATYNKSGETPTVTYQCEVSPDTYAEGANSIDVTYTDENGETATGTFTADADFYAQDFDVDSSEDTFYVGDSAKDALEKVTAKLGGTEEDITSSVTLSPAIFSEAGTITVTVNYEDKYGQHYSEKTFDVDVEELPEMKAELASGMGDCILVGDPIEYATDTYLFEITLGDKEIKYNDSALTKTPNVQNFTKAGEDQVFTFKYHDPETGKDFEATCSVDVYEPIESFTVGEEGKSYGYYAGETFDPSKIEGLTYSVTYRISSVTGKSAGTDIVDSENWSHERISWTNVTLKYGSANNEVTFCYTDPLLQKSLYKKLTFSGLSVVESVTITGTPVLFGGYTFRDCLLRSIDKGLVTAITVKFVEEDGRDDIVIVSSKDANLSRIDIPNTKLTEDETVSYVITYTDAVTGSVAKSPAITGKVTAMRYYDYEYASGYTPYWKGSVSKTSYSVGQAFSSTGIKLYLTNYWGEKEIVTEGFTYDYMWKTGSTYYVHDAETERALQIKDVRIRFHYKFLNQDGETVDAFDTAKKPNGKLGILYTNITVKTRTLSKIQITETPDKTTYEIGETFDTTGMEVTAVYGNGTKEVVTTYTFSPYEAFTKDDVGDQVIVISYTAGTVTKTASVAITVNGPAVPSMSVVLNYASLNLIEGREAELTATVYPTNASNKNVTWASSNETVATVSDKGVVTAVGTGTCLISATTCDYTHRYADCYVVVDAKTAVTKLKLEYSSLDLLKGDATTVSYTVTPSNATYESIEWTSSDSSVCSVNVDGQIKGLKAGTAVITATADGVSAKINVTVVTSLSYTGTVYNCKKSVNVRASASNTAKVIGSAALGKTFKVLDQSGKWYKIQYTTSKTGWIYADYLELANKSYDVDTEDSDSSSVETTSSSSTVYATQLTIVNCTRYCYVRKGPATTTSSLGHASAGVTYDLLGVSGDWYIINFNGSQGYVYKTFAQLS